MLGSMQSTRDPFNRCLELPVWLPYKPFQGVSCRLALMDLLEMLLVHLTSSLDQYRVLPIEDDLVTGTKSGSMVEIS